VCIVDVQGGIVCEAKVASEPEALIGFLRARELPIARVGLEVGLLALYSSHISLRLGLTALVVHPHCTSSNRRVFQSDIGGIQEKQIVPTSGRPLKLTDSSNVCNGW
jgi:hypothetical protein